MIVTVAGARLAGIHFLSSRSAGDAEVDLTRLGIEPSRDESVLADIVGELTRYFAGDFTTFTISLDLGAKRDFIGRVLTGTAEIPYGETQTYGESARVIGSPGATQAVGNALGANPIPIVIPCHRVIRGDGSTDWYTGRAGIKRTLLGLEGVHFPMQQPLDI